MKIVKEKTVVVLIRKSYREFFYALDFETVMKTLIGHLQHADDAVYPRKNKTEYTKHRQGPFWEE